MALWLNAFASGPKQVILQPVPYVDRKYCNKLVEETELACYLEYYVAQALFFP
jgi:hypothetical protein